MSSAATGRSRATRTSSGRSTRSARRCTRSVADGHARDLDGAVLAAAGVHVWEGARDGLRGLVPGDGRSSSSSTPASSRSTATRARGTRGTARRVHVVPAGEAAKTAAEAARLWSALRLERGADARRARRRLDDRPRRLRRGDVPARRRLGRRCRRRSSARSTRRSAARPAIDLAEGKNLVGAFHWPARDVVDPLLLETLPAEELENGRAEVVKTGLLAGEPLWELDLARAGAPRAPRSRPRSACATRYDRGERAQLNLGHTFAHALEAASGFALPHGRAVALGLLAALRLSGLEDEDATVEELLRAGAGARSTATPPGRRCMRDKKAAGGSRRASSSSTRRARRGSESSSTRQASARPWMR